jgi:hypothetical protein
LWLLNATATVNLLLPLTLPDKGSPTTSSQIETHLALGTIGPAMRQFHNCLKHPGCTRALIEYNEFSVICAV